MYFAYASDNRTSLYSRDLESGHHGHKDEHDDEDSLSHTTSSHRHHPHHHHHHHHYPRKHPYTPTAASKAPKAKVVRVITDHILTSSSSSISSSASPSLSIMDDDSDGDLTHQPDIPDDYREVSVSDATAVPTNHAATKRQDSQHKSGPCPFPFCSLFLPKFVKFKV